MGKQKVVKLKRGPLDGSAALSPHFYKGDSKGRRGQYRLVHTPKPNQPIAYIYDWDYKQQTYCYVKTITATTVEELQAKFKEIE